MNKQEAKQVLNHLYGLLLESNYKEAEEEVIRKLQETPDPLIEEHIKHVKRKMVQYAAAAKRNEYKELKEQFNELKKQGTDVLKSLLSNDEVHSLQPMFRKLEKLDSDDIESVKEDAEFLKFIELLKNKANEDRSE